MADIGRRAQKGHASTGSIRNGILLRMHRGLLMTVAYMTGMWGSGEKSIVPRGNNAITVLSTGNKDTSHLQSVTGRTQTD